MALTATRLDYRITLAHVDRALDRSESLIVAQHPSETVEHVTERVLAWCLLNEERLSFGPGLSARDTPDLWSHDLTGQVTTWVECGTADGGELRRVMQQHAGLRAHALFSVEMRAAALEKEVAAWPRFPRGATLDLWRLDPVAVDLLARKASKRQSWSVTVADEQLYVDVIAETFPIAVARRSFSAANE